VQIPFGYTRKDVILIGVGLTVFGVGLKYGLEVSPPFVLSTIVTAVLLDANVIFRNSIGVRDCTLTIF